MSLHNISSSKSLNSFAIAGSHAPRPSVSTDERLDLTDTTSLLQGLRRGFQKFREGYFADHVDLFRWLSLHGQKPRAMMISCCDSRADPGIMFSSPPGDLFAVRNVANLVPTYEFTDSGHHGTTAAIEFAVNFLKVRHIIVMGHRMCGGVKALMENPWEDQQGHVQHSQSQLAGLAPHTHHHHHSHAHGLGTSYGHSKVGRHIYAHDDTVQASHSLIPSPSGSYGHDLTALGVPEAVPEVSMTSPSPSSSNLSNINPFSLGAATAPSSPATNIANPNSTSPPGRDVSTAELASLAINADGEKEKVSPKAELPNHIANWMMIAQVAKQRTLKKHRIRSLDQVPKSERDAVLFSAELESVRLSIENLLTFPYVAEAVRKGELHLHGMHFDFTNGSPILRVLRRDTGEFVSIDEIEELWSDEDEYGETVSQFEF
eukprot:ANDGO_05676.mRNA.1 Carbonic anhydrase